MFSRVGAETSGLSPQRRFVQPEELEGSGVLILERDGENEIYFASSALGSTRRLTGPDQAANLVRTDFSYEDLQYLEGFLGGAWKRREDDDVFGDGVNIAARLEAIAEPGDIYVSSSIHEQTEDKVVFAAHANFGGGTQRTYYLERRDGFWAIARIEFKD